MVHSDGSSSKGWSPPPSAASYFLRGLSDLREDKSISVDPVGVLRVEGHELVEQDVGNRRHAHRGARVAGVGLGGGIDLSRSISMFVQAPCRRCESPMRWSQKILGNGGVGSIRTARMRMVLMAFQSASV
jgi:hypothetical protein